MNAARTFTCEGCGKTFPEPTGRTEAEVRAEHDARFPEARAATREQLSEVCGDCYAAFNVWFDGLPKRERDRMKREANRLAGRG